MSDGLIFIINLLGVIVLEAIMYIWNVLHSQELEKKYGTEVISTIITQNHLDKNSTEKELLDDIYSYYSSEKISNRISDMIATIVTPFYNLWGVVQFIAFIGIVLYLIVYDAYMNGGSFVLWVFILIDIIRFLLVNFISFSTRLLTNRFPGEAKFARNNLKELLKKNSILLPDYNTVGEQEVLLWSEKPGCFENQLKRQYNNPLFPPECRGVSQSQIDQARKSDANETNNFLQDIIKFRDEVLKQSRPTIDDFNKLRTCIEDLIIRAYQIGGVSLDELPVLTSLRSNLIDFWRNSFKNDNEKLELLNKAELYYNEQFSKFHNEFVMQFLRQDSPTKKFIVECILTEKDINNINRFVEFINDLDNENNMIERFREELVAKVNLAVSHGVNIPDLHEKLKILGVVLKN